jgi:hypothetical protein
MRQVGGSLGIAVMGAIVASVQSDRLRAGVARPDAFLDGFHRAVVVGAAILFAGAIVATLAIRKVEPQDERETAQRDFAVEAA